MKGVVMFLLILSPGLIFAPLVHAQKSPQKIVLSYAGQYFKNPSSPDFSSYNREMSTYVAKRIKAHYNVDLDFRSYSAFDLLEIEALLKCKKSGESVEPLLKRFLK